MKRTRHHPGQLDLFKVAQVIHFPLDRRAALWRATARTMSLKPTEKKRDYFFNNQLNRCFAQLLLDGFTPAEARSQVEAFRQRVVGEYTRIVYFESSEFDEPSDGDEPKGAA